MPAANNTGDSFERFSLENACRRTSVELMERAIRTEADEPSIGAGIVYPVFMYFTILVASLGIFG